MTILDYDGQTLKGLIPEVTPYLTVTRADPGTLAAIGYFEGIDSERGIAWRLSFVLVGVAGRMSAGPGSTWDSGSTGL